MYPVWTNLRPVTGPEEKIRQMKLFREVAAKVGSFKGFFKRKFEAGQIKIISPGKVAVNILGKKQRVIEGYCVVSRNVSNQDPLSIEVREGNLKQDPNNPNTLFLTGGGNISISGARVYDSLRIKDQLNKVSRPLPQDGPELTSIDGTEVFRTGKIPITIKQGGALIILS